MKASPRPRPAPSRTASVTASLPSSASAGSAISTVLEPARSSAGGAPPTQVLRNLTRADVTSDGRIHWGVLSNGQLWRLCCQGARSRTEAAVDWAPEEARYAKRSVYRLQSV